VEAQSPYQLNWKKESIYWGIGAATFTTSRLLKDEPLTLVEISNLQSSEVSAFDRSAIFNLSESARTTSDILLYGSCALTGVLFLNKKGRSDWKTIAVLYSETLLINVGITDLTKRVTKRTRPYAYGNLINEDAKQSTSARHSFFSGHTSLAATNSFFVAKLLTDYFPKNKWRYVIWSTAVLIPATTGYMRVKAGRHFKTDVIVGFIAGGLVGYFVPHFHKIQKGKDMSLQIAPTGFRFVKRF